MILFSNAKVFLHYFNAINDIDLCLLYSFMLGILSYIN